MAIEDEESRPEAVKRNAEPFAGFRALSYVVLERGDLINAAGEKEHGWALREPGERADTACFVMRKEPLLVTLSRLLVDQGYDFDVMCDGECVAELRLQRVTARQLEGKAFLFGLDGALLAELKVKARERVECFDEAGHQIFRFDHEHPHQVDLLVGERSIGRLLRVDDPRRLTTTFELELSFLPGASGFERLLAAAATVVGEAWKRAKDSSDNDVDILGD
jgi:hypothetical protein